MENQPPQGNEVEDKEVEEANDDLIIMSELERIEKLPPKEESETPEAEDTTPTDEPMPSSEKESEGTKQEEEAKPEESVTPEGEADEDELELPEGASERTREQFEKLKQRNKDLADENAKLKTPAAPVQPKPSVIDDFRTVVPEQLPEAQRPIVDAGNYNNLKQSDINDVLSQLVETDEDGNQVIDIGKVQEVLLASDKKAAAAAELAQEAISKVNKQNETAQLKVAYEKYPQLDPNSDQYDPNFREMVRDRLVRHYVNDQDVPLVDVASSIASVYAGTQPKPVEPPVPPETIAKEREKAVQDFKKAQEDKKRQRPIASGKGAPRSEEIAKKKELRGKARTGDLDALAELL